MMNFVFKNEEFCIYIKDLCLKNKEIFVFLKMMNFAGRSARLDPGTCRYQLNYLKDGGGSGN